MVDVVRNMRSPRNLPASARLERMPDGEFRILPVSHYTCVLVNNWHIWCGAGNSDLSSFRVMVVSIMSTFKPHQHQFRRRIRTTQRRFSANGAEGGWGEIVIFMGCTFGASDILNNRKTAAAERGMLLVSPQELSENVVRCFFYSLLRRTRAWHSK